MAVKAFTLVSLLTLAWPLLAHTQAQPQLAPEQVEAYIELVREHAIPLDAPGALDPLILEAAQRPFVLLGESSHGTHEFYTLRNEICQRLIAEHGFRYIVVEGDWDAALRVNSYVKQLPGAPESAREAVGHFTRWPGWLWNNQETLELAEWMREYNEGRPPEEQAGFYGMDLYGVPGSMDAAIAYLEQVDAAMARRAAEAYACLRPFTWGIDAYAQALVHGAPSCTRQVAAVVDMLETHAPRLRAADPVAHFHALRHAVVVKSFERLSRAALEAPSVHWNARVDHFTDTVEQLAKFHGAGAKGIVLGHNTHIGDARATRMAPAGRHNVGQRLRENQGEAQVYAVGISTHRGEVMAAVGWGAPVQRMTTPPAAPGSLEDILHRTGLGDFRLKIDERLRDGILAEAVGHRMIGAENLPDIEPPSMYVATRLAHRYDAFIFLEETSALQVFGN